MHKKQWDEIKNLYSVERYLLLKEITVQVPSTDETLKELDTEYSDTIQDVNFHSIVEYLDQVTDDDLLIHFSFYGIHSLYIDETGKGLLVLAQ